MSSAPKWTAAYGFASAFSTASCTAALALMAKMRKPQSLVIHLRIPSVMMVADHADGHRLVNQKSTIVAR